MLGGSSAKTRRAGAAARGIFGFAKILDDCQAGQKSFATKDFPMVPSDNRLPPLQRISTMATPKARVERGSWRMQRQIQPKNVAFDGGGA